MAMGRGTGTARVLASAPMLREFCQPARVIVLALAIAIATTSCGIKGPLTLPPKASPAGAPAPTDGKPADPKSPARDSAAPRAP